MKDKKKLMVLAALGVVLIGVGAFTFIGGSEPPPAAPTPKKDAKVADAKTGDAPDKDAPKNPMFAQALPQRDPFTEGSLPNTMTGQPVAPATTQKLPPPTRSQRPPRDGGSVPPFKFDKTGELPGVGQIGLQSSGPDPMAFGYRVSGVIVGARPAAVFTDSQGNQRLVAVGASLDGDSKVVAIERGQVTVQYRGKTLRLTLGGTPNEK